MSLILYYSNFCEHSKELLIYLARNNNRKDMYFVCIDKREIKPNGQIYVTMPDGQKLLLPKQVEHVPAILLLNHGNRVLFGQDIYNFFHQENEEKKNKATKGNGEPLAFSTLEMGNTMSDNYSYWNIYCISSCNTSYADCCIYIFVNVYTGGYSAKEQISTIGSQFSKQ